MIAVVIERYGSGGNQKRVVSTHDTLADARAAVRDYDQSRADGLGITLAEWRERITLQREGERWAEGVVITGGERGFRAAVHDAIYGRGEKIMSPAVRWSRGEGFFVEPAANLYPLQSGEVEIWQANLSADTGKPYGLPDYSEVRERILHGQCM